MKPKAPKENIRSLLRPFVAIYTSMFLMAVSLGLLSTLLSLRLTLEGFPPRSTGMILTAYFVGSAAGTFMCTRVIKKVGHIRAFAAFASLATAMVMLHGCYVSGPAWAVFRFFCGIATIGMYMVIESWLNACTQPAARGRIFSIYMVMCYLGGSVGQQLLNLVDVQKQTLFLIVGLLMTACVIPVSLTRTIHPKIAQIKPMGLKRIFKQAPMGLLGCFTSGLLTSSFYTMGPVFCTQLHLSVTHLSYFMTFTVLGGLLFQWPVGAITDRFDRSQVLPVLSCALAVFCGLMILTIQSSLTVLLAGSIVFGGLMFTIYPTAVARAHDMFEPHNVVTVSSALLLFYGVGAVTGPVVSSAAIEFFPRPYGLFIYFSGIGLLYALVSFLLRLKEIALVIPVEEQVDFIIMNHTSQVAIQIDPRTQTDQTVP